MSWRTELCDAFVDAFQPAEFDRAVQHIDRQRTTYSGNNPFPDVVLAVINGAESENWTSELVRAALWFKSGNRKLQAFRNAYPARAPAPLKPQELEFVAVAIRETYPLYSDLARLVQNRHGQDLDIIAERQAGPPPQDASQRLLRWFDARGMAKEIIQTCVDARPEPTLQVAARKVLASLQAQEIAAGFSTPDPYEACLIDNQVFLGREPLRQALRRWSPPPLRQVFAVHGPKRSGKSYSLELVYHIATRTRSIQVASINLYPDTHLYVPLDLTNAVMLQMGHATLMASAPQRANSSSDARYISELCNWIIATAQQSTMIWVIAIDGSHLDDVPENMRDMIRGLVRGAARPGSPIRVMLLGYTEDLLPSDVRRRVAHEQLQMLTEKELHECLEKLLCQLAITAEPGVLDDIVADIRLKTAFKDIESVAHEVQRWLDEMQVATS